MAIVKVYNKVDESVYGEIDTDKFIFNNFSNGKGTFTCDEDLYPYVKIDNVYYKNNGMEWEYTNGNKTASLMSIEHAYKDKDNSPLKNSFSFLTEDYKNPKLDNFWGTINGINGLITVGNYRFNGKYLQAISCGRNQTDKGIPYNHKDNQPFLPMYTDEEGDGTNIKYYWDSISNLELSRYNYLFASNFSEKNTSLTQFEVEVDEKYVYCYERANFIAPLNLMLKIERKWMPYITIAIKQTRGGEGDLSLKGSNIEEFGFDSFKQNKIYFNTRQTGRLSHSPIDICVIGGYGVDRTYNTNGYKRVVTISQTTEMSFISLKLYTNTHLVFTKNGCEFNSYYRKWDDLVNDINKNELKNDNFLENLFECEEYEVYLDEFKSQFSNEDDNEFRDGFITFLGDSTTSYPNIFTGYYVFLKGKDYWVKPKQITKEKTEINKINDNDDSLSPWSTNGVLELNTTYKNPSFSILDVDDFTVNGKSMKEKYLKSGNNWKGCKVNLLNFMHKLEGNCGTISPNLFLTNYTWYTSYDTEMNHKEREKEQTFLEEKFGEWISGGSNVWEENMNNWPESNGSYAPNFGGLVNFSFSENENQQYNNSYISCYLYKNVSRWPAKDEDMVSYGGLRIGYEAEPSTGWCIIASANEDRIKDSFKNLTIGYEPNNKIYLKYAEDVDQYVAFSNFGKKVCLPVLLKDGSVDYYYIFPYSRKLISHKSDSIHTFKAPQILED